MNLHIELDSSHPAYGWLEKQADKIGAKGHFGTHIDCYTSIPTHSEYHIPIYIIDCQNGMPTLEDVATLPSLHGKALLLFTANMYHHEYGSHSYFSETDTSLEIEVLQRILEKSPQLILIDSYGIGKHGQHHIERDMLCEENGCYVIENIYVTPEESKKIQMIHVKFDLNYPSTGKPCKVTY